MDNWLKTGVVAQRYDVTPQTVRAWILDDTCEVLGKRVGGHWRVSEESLDRFDAEGAAE